MIYSREILDVLEGLRAEEFSGIVFRHMFGEYPPERENIDGARWNPPGTRAIYTSLTRDGALAESEYQISLQPARPKAKRTIYTIAVSLASVVDLRIPAASRTRLGLRDIGGISLGECQAVGGAVEWLGHDGLLVSSVRHTGGNLVIYPARTRESRRFDSIGVEVIAAGEL